MHIPLVVPSRKLFNMFLCSMGACVIAILTFPPHDPPPCFPMIPFWNNKEDES